MNNLDERVGRFIIGLGSKDVFEQKSVYLVWTMSVMRLTKWPNPDERLCIYAIPKEVNAIPMSIIRLMISFPNAFNAS
jgi:hypothetical protein